MRPNDGGFHNLATWKAVKRAVASGNATKITKARASAENMVFVVCACEKLATRQRDVKVGE